MHDQPRLVFRRVDFPQLLDADAVGLRIDAVAQIEFLPQRLGQRAAAALGEDRLAGVQFHARLEGVAGLAVLADAEVAGGDALDRTILVVEHLGRGEPGVDLDAKRLGLLAQPAGEIAQADDVVAVVAHLRRRRQLERARFAQVEQAVLSGRRVERGAAFLPVGKQLGQRVRFEHGAGEDVGADFRALLQQADRDLPALLLGQLLDADCRGQPRGASADDHDIVFHRFAIGAHGRSQNRFSGSAKTDALPAVIAAASPPACGNWWSAK